MIFLTSLFFVVLLYVIPGILVLNLLSSMLEMTLGLSSFVWLSVLHVGVYVGVFFVVRLAKLGYDELQLDREPCHKEIKNWLRVRGCQWLNGASILLIAAGSGVLLMNGALPLQFAFLFGAILIGFSDILHKDSILEWRDPLPDVHFEDGDVAQTAEGKEIVLRWEKGECGFPGSCAGDNLMIWISENSYKAAREIARYPTRPITEYARYIKKGQTAEVSLLASKLRAISNEKRYTPLEEVVNVVALVRSIPYATDEQTHNVPEYANFPIETIYESDNGSDCEDHALLAAALLDVLGHRVGLFHLELEGSGHLALGYSTDVVGGSFCRSAPNNHIYYYMETVPCGSENGLGQISSDFLKELKSASVVVV
jgi:hypothetical protein